MKPDGSFEADLPEINKGDVPGDKIVIVVKPESPDEVPEVSNLVIKVCKKFPGT